MILGFPRAKQGLCHTKHGEAGGIILWALLTVFLVLFALLSLSRFKWWVFLHDHILIVTYNVSPSVNQCLIGLHVYWVYFSYFNIYSDTLKCIALCELFCNIFYHFIPLISTLIFMQNRAQYKVQNFGALLEVKRKMCLGFLKSHKTVLPL